MLDEEVPRRDLCGFPARRRGRACGLFVGRVPEPEATETQAAVEVTGELHIGKFGGSLGEAMLSIVPEFEAKYPGVTVTNEDTNSPQLITTLIANRNQTEGAFDLVNLEPRRRTCRR